MNENNTLYNQVYQHILNDIYNGKYNFYDKIPTLEQLGVKYGVGRNTLRSALQLLESNGFIATEKGSNAVVIFDFHNEEHNHMFLEMLASKKDSVSDVFQTLGLLMPNISVKSIQNASEEQRKEINRLIKQLAKDTSIQDENALREELMKIYLYVFSILENDLIVDMFRSIMDFIFFPLPLQDREHGGLQSNIKMIKMVLSQMLSFIMSGNIKMLGKAIRVFCNIYEKITVKYMVSVSNHITVNKVIDFNWKLNPNTELLYVKVLTKILIDLDRGEYKPNDLLPSIEQLSTRYDVSPRTIRKTIKILNELNVVKTMNGVGSRVVFKQNQEQSLLQTFSLYNNLKVYYEALELLGFIVEATCPDAFHSMKEEDIQHIINEIETSELFTLTSIIEYLKSTMTPSMQLILTEVRKQMIWNMFIRLIAEKNQCSMDFTQDKELLLTALKANKRKNAVQIINATLEKACILTKKLFILEA
ncbi:MAG: GntR family transcriptional regulator [Longicatena sp.]